MKKLILILCFVILIPVCNKGHFSIIQKWENGVVYYRYDNYVKEEHQIIIRIAMDEWEKTGCVKFVPYKGKKNYANIYSIKMYFNSKSTKFCDGVMYNLSSASSSVGYVPYNNTLTIINDTSVSMMLHELGHCLGLQHEHQRPDRDKYIKIIKKNVDSKYYKNNFEILEESEFLIPYDKFDYDYDSIMHYEDETAHKDCGLKTIKAPKPIRGEVLSDTDKAKIKAIYCEK